MPGHLCCAGHQIALLYSWKGHTGLSDKAPSQIQAHGHLTTGLPSDPQSCDHSGIHKFQATREPTPAPPACGLCAIFYCVAHTLPVPTIPCPNCYDTAYACAWLTRLRKRGIRVEPCSPQTGSQACRRWSHGTAPTASHQSCTARQQGRSGQSGVSKGGLVGMRPRLNL